MVSTQHLKIDLRYFTSIYVTEYEILRLLFSVVEVGFNQSAYFVAETESVSVCVDLISPEAIQENALVVLTVSTGEGTASG